MSKPRTPYQKLIRRLRKISPEAAEQCKVNIKLNHRPHSQPYQEKSQLIELFVWKETPQGHLYWEKLHRKLNNGEW